MDITQSVDLAVEKTGLSEASLAEHLKLSDFKFKGYMLRGDFSIFRVKQCADFFSMPVSSFIALGEPELPKSSKDGFFAYDPECGFDTYDTAEGAKDAAEEILDSYRDNASDGWDEASSQICWGKISECANMFKTGDKIEFDDELVDCCDYKFEPINS